jgi:hypothetical protein
MPQEEVEQAIIDRLCGEVLFTCEQLRLHHERSHHDFLNIDCDAPFGQQLLVSLTSPYIDVSVLCVCIRRLSVLILPSAVGTPG